MPGVKRSRNSALPPTRRERAQATRARIIDAAHRLFVERGYTGATMADIATAAGVAVQTVYFVFHTKPELLQECYNVAVLGPNPAPPDQQPWYADLLAADRPSAALGHFAHGITTIAARAGALDDIVRAAAHEPEAVAVRAHSEQLRRDGFRRIVEHVADRFGLAPGLDADAATDIMLALASNAMYRALVLDYGWSEARFEEWLTGALVRELTGTSG